MIENESMVIILLVILFIAIAIWIFMVIRFFNILDGKINEIRDEFKNMELEKDK